jgi:hypothetical protein
MGRHHHSARPPDVDVLGGLAEFERELIRARTPPSQRLRRSLEQLAPGDVLTVTRLDRLARSTRDLLDTLAATFPSGSHTVLYNRPSISSYSMSIRFSQLFCQNLQPLAERALARPSGCPVRQVRQ